MTAWAAVQEYRLLAVADRSISGELLTYEASRADLVLRTDSGDRHFKLPHDTPVHEGARDLGPGALVSASGCPAKIWYRDTGGTWIAHDVRISCNPTVPHGAPSSF